MSILKKLQHLDREGTPIVIGANGSGWMGSGFVAALRDVPGMALGAYSTEDPDEGARVLTELGGYQRDDVVVATNTTAANDARRSGKVVVTDSSQTMVQVEGVDIATDVTPYPDMGARTAFDAIQHEKDVVLINIEADVTVGRELKRRAADAGVLYSVSSGDEPGCLMELWDFVGALGYEPVVIGKGKNNPLNPAATPDTVRDSAAKADKDPYQVASYVDGTKTMFELTCVANATGCVPTTPGMTGPEADLSTVADLFVLKEDGGALPHTRVVDYVQGSAMAGGVFITVKIDNARVADDLTYLKVGKGPYFTFFRPYHLWFLEAPISIARAYFYRETTLVPLDTPVADVATVAKRDLAPGDTLDTFGGYTFRGVNYRFEEFSSKNALPVGVAPGATLVKPVKIGEIVTWDDVTLDETAPVVQLRRSQDAHT